MESSRQNIKNVARPEDNRKELENTPRAETPRDSSVFTRMQEIQKKIIDEDYTLEEIQELENLINEKKKTKKNNIKGEEPDVPGGFTVGTKMTTSVNSSPSIATEEVVEEEIDKDYHGKMIIKHDKSIAVEKNKDKPDPNVLRDHERAADYHRKALKTNNPYIAADARTLSNKLQEEVEQVDELDRQQGSILNRYISRTNPDFSSPEEIEKRKEGRALALKKKWGDKKYGTDEPKVKAVQRENVEFSEAELEHFNAVLEGRGRPKKSEDNPNTSSGRDPRQHIQVLAGQAAGGRNIDFTHNNGDKTTITPSMGRKITDHLNSLKPADRQAAVNKMHASAGGLKLSEDLEQIDEFQGTIKKPATPSSMMSKATAAKGKLQQKQTTSLIKQKLDAQKRELLKRQQTAQTASQRSAIKT
jgi:hypothetical protein